MKIVGATNNFYGGVCVPGFILGIVGSLTAFMPNGHLFGCHKHDV